MSNRSCFHPVLYVHAHTHARIEDRGLSKQQRMLRLLAYILKHLLASTSLHVLVQLHTSEHSSSSSSSNTRPEVNVRFAEPEVKFPSLF